MSEAPSLHIILELEAKPRSCSDCPHEGDALRLADWMTASDDAVELIEAFLRWKEAA